MQSLAIIPSVADLPALDGLEELGRIGRLDGVMVTPLTGRVTRQDVARALQARLWDAVIWIGHGLPSQLLLSDGDTIRPPWLASMMRRRVRLAVLSVCESALRPAVGHGLVTGFSDTLPAAGVSLVAMSFAVDDRAAMAYDVALMQALAAGAPGWQAHQAALGAISGSSMIQAPQYYEGVPVNDFRDGGGGGPADLTRMVYDLVARQTVVEAKMGGIAEDVSELRVSMRELRSDIKAQAPARQQVAMPREVLVLAALSALAALGILIFVAWRLA